MEGSGGLFSAIVLAGGAGRRLGGVDKPAVLVAGVPMIDRVLDAVRTVGPPIVVGPERPDVETVREYPTGGGPVAAIGAAFDAYRSWLTDVVAIVGADLPLLDAAALGELRTVAARGRVDGAVFTDSAGQRQWLCGAWRTAVLADRLAALGEERGDLIGAALRDLFGPLAVAEVRHDDGPPPWFDCDTDDDIRRAEEWLTR
jgi:molybdopterin-guanine dinucleotide biosynthesis protein A